MRVTSLTSFAAAASVCFLSLPCRCAAKGTIVGSVTDTSGAAIAGVWVDAYDSSENWIAAGYTDSGGAYDIVEMVNGTYYFRTTVSSGYFLDEWYDGIQVSDYGIPPGATPVVVSSGFTNIINFALEEGGAIGGKVTGTAGAPLSNVWVDAYDLDGNRRSSSFTGANGAFEIAGLPEGVYFVRTDTLTQNYVDEWFSNVTAIGWDIPSSVQPVVAQAGILTSNVDFSLAAGAVLTGRTRDPAGLALSNIWIDTYAQTGEFVESALTATNGTFRTIKLPAGTFCVRTYSGSANRVDEWFDNVPVLGSDIPTNAVRLALTAGATITNIQFVLDRGARISGVVSNTHNAVVTNASVDLYTPQGVWVKSAKTGTNGAYAASALPASTYYVRTVSDPQNFVDQWYSGLDVFGADMTNATAIAVTSGAAVAAIDFALRPGGLIAGRVAATNGSGIRGVDVYAYDSATNWLKGTTTDTNGAYRLPGLPAPGVFYVVTETSPLNYANQWYSGVPVMGDGIPGSAASLLLGSGSVTGNIDFALAQGGVVSGRLTNARSVPLAGEPIGVYQSDGTRVRRDETAYDGKYRVSGLPSGVFYVRTEVADLNCVNEWYDRVIAGGYRAPAAATAVTMAPGAIASGIDFALQPGGAITGRVTDTHGTNLTGIGIDAYDGGTNWMAEAITTAGVYRIQGLCTQSVFFVRTYAPAPYADQWFHNAPLIAAGVPPEAAAIAAPTGGAASVSFALALGVSITGRVTDAAGSPVAGVGVQVYRPDGTLIASTATDGTGFYVLSRLAPGTYDVRTASQGTGFADAWFPDVPVDGTNVPAEAADLSLAEGASTGAVVSVGFRIVSAGALSDSQPWVQWQAASGTTYQVQFSTNLTAWTNAFSGTNTYEQSRRSALSQGLFQYRDPDRTRARAFYRIRIP